MGELYGHPGRRGGYALISYVCSQHCIQSLLRPIDRQAAIPKEIQKGNIYLELTLGFFLVANIKFLYERIRQYIGIKVMI